MGGYLTTIKRLRRNATADGQLNILEGSLLKDVSDDMNHFIHTFGHPRVTRRLVSTLIGLRVIIIVGHEFSEGCE